MHKMRAARRELGHNPLNAPFIGADYHHLRHKKETGSLDNDIGLYIPKAVHESVRHNGNTGKNMAAINLVALKWYITNTPLKEQSPIAIDLYKHYNQNKS
jgi:hypothetical protein